MTLLEYLSHWVESERPTLNALGKLHYRVSPDDGRDKPSAHVAVVREGYSAELIVWSSGEAEFGYGRPEHATFEHRELESKEDLKLLLVEFLSSLA
jgi:hypothetical protein